MNSQRWFLLIAANIAFYVVLCFYQTGRAAPRITPPEPFSNHVNAQRDAMVDELRQIRGLLEQQNALLQSGKVKVIVAE